MIKIKIGKAYTIKESTGKKNKIYRDVIALNNGGSSGFQALALLKKPREIDLNMRVVLHIHLVVKYNELENVK